MCEDWARWVGDGGADPASVMDGQFAIMEQARRRGLGSATISVQYIMCCLAVRWLGGRL